MKVRFGRRSINNSSTQNYMEGFNTTALPSDGLSMPTVKSDMKSKLNVNSKNLKRLGLVVLFIALVITIPRLINLRTGSSNGQTLGASIKNVEPITISKAYAFNARNDQGKIIDKKPVNVTLVNAEINKQILIKGQPATARDGKAFLIMNVELENPYTEKVYLPVNDFVRWQDGNKLRAPDVHNGYVLIDPISTKTTRLGFLIDDNARNFSIKIGEVNTDKQTIDLTF